MLGTQEKDIRVGCKNQRLLFFGLLIVSLISCNNSEHKKYIDEYIAIDKTSNILTPIIRHYRSIINTITQRQQLNGFKPDAQYEDSMRAYSEILQDSFAHCIKIINSISEMDSEINIKYKLLNAVNYVSQVYSKMTNKYVKICALGQYIAETSSTKDEWDFSEDINNINQRMNEFLSAEKNYLRKHHINLIRITPNTK